MPEYCADCGHAGKLKNGVCQEIVQVWNLSDAQLAAMHEDFRGEAGIKRCGHRCVFPATEQAGERSHARYCGLASDHEGECSAVVTRLLVPASNIAAPATPVAQPGAGSVDSWLPGTCWSAEEKLSAEIVTKWLATADRHYADLMSMIAEALKPTDIAITAAVEAAKEIEKLIQPRLLHSCKHAGCGGNSDDWTARIAAVISRYLPAQQLEVGTEKGK